MRIKSSSSRWLLMIVAGVIASAWAVQSLWERADEYSAEPISQSDAKEPSLIEDQQPPDDSELTPGSPDETVAVIGAETDIGFATTVAGNGVYTWRVRGIAGEVLREFKTEYPTPSSEVWVWQRDFFHAAGRVLGSEGNAALGWQYGKLRYHSDHSGSPRAITNGAGQLAGSHAYSPYGEELVTAGDQTVHRYTGHERDTAQQDYMRARYYRNDYARFLSPDPARSGWNAYVYAGNNPVSKTDPTGNFDESFHGALTYYLGLAAGLTQEDAAKIALYTAMPDHDKRNPARVLDWFNGKTAHHHFDSDGKGRFYEELAKGGHIDWVKLGGAMHVYQDMGEPGIPGPHRGKCKLPCTANGVMQYGPGGPVWSLAAIFAKADEVGHPIQEMEDGSLGGPWNDFTDRPYKNPRRNTAIAWEVYRMLKDLSARLYGTSSGYNDAMAWGAIDSLMAAKTHDQRMTFAGRPGRLARGGGEALSFVGAVENRSAYISFGDQFTMELPVEWNVDKSIH